MPALPYSPPTRAVGCLAADAAGCCWRAVRCMLFADAERQPAAGGLCPPSHILPYLPISIERQTGVRRKTVHSVTYRIVSICRVLQDAQRGSVRLVPDQASIATRYEICRKTVHSVTYRIVSICRVLQDAQRGSVRLVPDRASIATRYEICRKTVCYLAFLAQESFNATVRLNTAFSAELSLSLQKYP